MLVLDADIIDFTPSKPYRNNKTGVPGVYWHKQSSSWMVTLTYRYQLYNFGKFTDFLKAKKVRENAEKILFVGKQHNLVKWLFRRPLTIKYHRNYIVLTVNKP
jgi:hypothetical protein